MSYKLSISELDSKLREIERDINRAKLDKDFALAERLEYEA